MHFPDCTHGKEGDACDCAERAASAGIVPDYTSASVPAAPADPEGGTMIEARRVRGLVVFYPKRWRPAKDATERGEWVPLVYSGANPSGFAYFTNAERVVLRYEAGPGDDAPEARWDVDAGEWVA